MFLYIYLDDCLEKLCVICYMDVSHLQQSLYVKYYSGRKVMRLLILQAIWKHCVVVLERARLVVPSQCEFQLRRLMLT